VTTYTAYVYTVVDEAARTVRPVPKAQKPVRTYTRVQTAYHGITQSIQTICSPMSRRIRLVYPDGRPDEWYMPQWALRASTPRRDGYTNAWRLLLPVQCQPYVLADEESKP